MSPASRTRTRHHRGGVAVSLRHTHKKNHARAYLGVCVRCVRKKCEGVVRRNATVWRIDDRRRSIAPLHEGLGFTSTTDDDPDWWTPVRPWSRSVDECRMSEHHNAFPRRAFLFFPRRWGVTYVSYVDSGHHRVRHDRRGRKGSIARHGTT